MESMGSIRRRGTFEFNFPLNRTEFRSVLNWRENNFFFLFSCIDARKWYIRVLGSAWKSKGNENREHFSSVDGKHKRGYFWFWIFLVSPSSLPFFESFAKDLRNPRSQIFAFLHSNLFSSPLFPSFRVSSRRRMNYTQLARTHTYTHAWYKKDITSRCRWLFNML